MSATLLALLPGNPSPVRGSASKITYHAPTDRIAYPQGRTVILRSLSSSPSPAAYSGGGAGGGGLKFALPGSLAYAQHAHPVTLARFSPSGFYCASADTSGTVRIWDVLGTDLVLKLEYKALSGPVKDLAWDAESKRIMAVGEGRDKFGSVFMIDGGSSAGTVEGHSKSVNAVAMNRQRPFRAITGSDDAQIGWYNGTPYKLATTIAQHTRFVQSVAFSAQGTYALSAGSDSKLFLFDGKSGALLSDLTVSAASDAHKGTIYGVEFHPQKEDVFASTGADGFLKIWQVQEGGKGAKVLESFDLRSSTSSSAAADDQQVALCFAGADRVVSLGLSSDLFVAHLGTGGQKVEKISAPSKSITSISATSSSSSKKLYAGSYDGKVCEWDLQPVVAASSSVNLTTSGGSVACQSLIPSSSTGSAAVTGVAIHNASGIILSVGLDDTLKWLEPSSSSSSATTATAVSLSGQPRSLAVSQTNGTAYVATTSSSAAGNFDVVPAGSGTKSASQVLSSMPGAIAVHPNGDIVAVGTEDAKVRLFAVSGSGMKELSGSTLNNGKTAIAALAFSPDGTLLAAGESSGKIVVYDVSAITASGGGEGKVKILHWVFHTARINSIAFSPDGDAAVSGSLDTNIYIWSVSKPSKNISIKNAHAGGVNSVCWIDEKRIASAGSDACVRLYDIKRRS